MKLYPDREKEFREEAFAEPSAEYRDVPFWAWNTAMTKEDVDFCIGIFREMGMGGAFLHSRTGMALPYLGEEFLELIKYAAAKAGEAGLRPWLYDEDRWPSGFAGGLVTKDEKYRNRFLMWSPGPCPAGEIMEELPSGSTAAPVLSGKRKLLGIYEVVAKDGFLESYRLLEKAEEAREGAVWWAYLEIGGDNLWFNGQAYVDTLNPDAVAAFLKTTYEKYAEALGKDFGGLIPGIFTDEPQFTAKQRAGSIEERKRLFLPFTDRLPELFEQEFGYDLPGRLPELFYEKKGEISQARYHYHRLVSALFAESYCLQIGKWCEAHGIALTGHLMKEPLLSSQCAYIGEAMACYAGFTIPGIDILCDRREFTTAKQAQSAVNQFGREGMISELYGVTNWDYDFRGHKLQGDWQAALGVTVRAPHLAWTSMEGEAKRDYPAPIFYQSPWYAEYRLIEDYFARIAMVMSRGRAVAPVGVLHPIETCWLQWGSQRNTSDAVAGLDENFVRLTEWLASRAVGFDFLSEALLPKQYGGVSVGEDGAPEFRVGKAAYRILLVPFLKTMRRTTLRALLEWKAAGGRLLFLGEIPSYMEGSPSEEIRRLAEGCDFLPSVSSALYEKLRDHAAVELYYGDLRRAELYCGDLRRAEDLLCQERQDGEERFLFLAHKYAPAQKDQVEERRLTVRVRGLWRCTVLNALEGGTEECVCEYADGCTVLTRPWYEHDSLLLRLRPYRAGQPDQRPALEEALQYPAAERPYRAEQPDQRPARGEAPRYPVSVPSGVRITLSEPNVLVLDLPESSLDGEPWQGQEEILRLDNRLRKRLGYPLRTEAYPQPWVMRTAGAAGCAAPHRIRLRYAVRSRIDCAGVLLAVEKPRETAIFWNGEAVESRTCGWYVDRRICTVALGPLRKGTNELLLERSFDAEVDLEAVYLLGDFGVAVAGRDAEITEPVRELSFGDWTVQGLPFYGGNVTYHIPIRMRGGSLHVEAAGFAAPLLAVSLQGRRQGVIAFSPYRLETEKAKGDVMLAVTAYGSRVNTFGALHNTDLTDNRSAPDYWRTTGSAWSYEYCLRPAGIWKAPEIYEQM